jgi:hypothetical protein
VRSVPMYQNAHWISYVTIHCPTARTFRLLADLETRNSWRVVKNRRGKVAPNLHISWVHIARDLLVATKDDAETVQQFVRRHIRKRWSRDAVIVVKDVRYTNRRWSSTNLADYSGDEECHGEQCCHFEFRLQRSHAVTRAGIRSVSDLMGLNLAEFWETRFLLFDYDLRLADRIGKVLLGRSHLRKSTVRELRRGDRVLYRYNQERSAGNALIRKIQYVAAEHSGANRFSISDLFPWLEQYDMERGPREFMRNISSYLLKIDAGGLCRGRQEI